MFLQEIDQFQPRLIVNSWSLNPNKWFSKLIPKFSFFTFFYFTFLPHIFQNVHNNYMWTECERIQPTIFSLNGAKNLIMDQIKSAEDKIQKNWKDMVFQFQKLSSTNFTWLILEYFVSNILWSAEDAGGTYCAQNLF